MNHVTTRASGKDWPRLVLAGLSTLLVTMLPLGLHAKDVKPLNQFWLDAYGASPSGMVTQSFVQPGPLDRPRLLWELLAKAEPDELYEGRPKINESYVFSLTQANDRLWFGTASNMLCQVLASDFGIAIPLETANWVCEADDSNMPQSLFADFRPPSIYTYELGSGTLTEVSDQLTGADLARLNNTYGLRAAGTLNGVVLLAGPALGNQSVNIFAFRASDSAFLASATYTQWGNVRDARTIGGGLYFAMQETATLPAPQGSIQRWTGTLNNPLQFQTVGTIPLHAAAFLAGHDGRIFASTWSGLGNVGLPDAAQIPSIPGNGIFMSPPIPNGGEGVLPASNANWQRVFDFKLDYETDPLVGLTYFGGAMASYGDYLYFGTINNPIAGPFAAILADQQNVIRLCGDDTESTLNAILGTFRPISVFRGRNLGTPGQEIELLYGSEFWPSLVPDTDDDGACVRYDIFPLADHRNRLNQAPSLGLAGINNFFNAYTWTMDVYKESLFLGTFDWSSVAVGSILEGSIVDLIPQALEIITPDESINALIQYPLATVGADLWRFDDTTSPARPETLGGFSNWSNYGIRSLFSGEELCVGTANPFNLRAGTADNTDGGWELICSKTIPAKPVPALSGWMVIPLALAMLALVGLNRRRHGQG